MTEYTFTYRDSSERTHAYVDDQQAIYFARLSAADMDDDLTVAKVFNRETKQIIYVNV